MNVTIHISIASLACLMEDYMVKDTEPANAHEIPFSFGKTSLHNVPILMTLGEFNRFKKSQERLLTNSANETPKTEETYVDSKREVELFNHYQTQQNKLVEDYNKLTDQNKKLVDLITRADMLLGQSELVIEQYSKTIITYDLGCVISNLKHKITDLLQTSKKIIDDKKRD